MLASKRYSNYVIYLIVISTIVRGVLAAILELGNDEVYYRLYGLYPDWSHFDHPLMIGLLIQISTLDMLFQSEFFLRLGSVIIGAANIWMFFKIGRLIGDSRTGYYTSLLYVASIYASIITGVFILPDTPQSLFWIWALYVIIKTVPLCPHLPMSGINFLKIGILIGLGIISKYTTVFLWIGIGLYIILYNREWLKSIWLYLSLIVTFIISLPILVWNIKNNFISINFHSERVDMTGYSIDMDYFLTEIIGELLYNNPVVYILIIIGIVAAISKKLNIEKSHIRIILISGLPIILTFIIFSLFRRTLPHWTAPGVTTLIPIAAVYVSQKYSKSKTKLPWTIVVSLVVTCFTIITGVAQINFGIVQLGNNQEYHRIGKDDPSLDMYGYKQAGSSFKKIVERDKELEIMSENSIYIGSNWFPLANYDYYAAKPSDLASYGIGNLSDLHKYAWINNENEGFKIGMDAYYLTDSREYDEPDSIFYKYFEKVIPGDTIQIYRGSKVAKRVFVYRMKNLHTIPKDLLDVHN